jgi:hypothetical protein
MTGQMQIVFGILVGAVGLFVCGRPRADVVAIVVVLALMFSQSSSGRRRALPWLPGSWP